KTEPLDQRAEGASLSIVAHGEERARLLADDALLVPVGDLDVQVVPNGFAHEFDLSLRKMSIMPADRPPPKVAALGEMPPKPRSPAGTELSSRRGYGLAHVLHRPHLTPANSFRRSAVRCSGANRSSAS